MKDKSRSYNRPGGKGEKPVYINRLCELRKKMSWSQAYVGHAVNVTVITIGSIERGNSLPRAKTKQKLAELFNSTVEYMFPVDEQGRPVLKGGPPQIIESRVQDVAPEVQSPEPKIESWSAA